MGLSMILTMTLEQRITAKWTPKTLGEKQELFALLIYKLQGYIISEGYDIRLGHAFRCENCVTGSRNSNHKLKLALDINLFKAGQFLQQTADHKPFGEFWESLHPLCRWGGRFNDGNHYSLEHQGRK